MDLIESNIFDFLELLKKVNKLNNNIDSKINLRSWKDKGDKFPKNKVYDLNKLDNKGFFNELQTNTKNKLGSHITFNYIKEKVSKGQGISKTDITTINFIFIDVDFHEETQEIRNKLISDFEMYLLNNELNYHYKSKGKNGFHYLFPINLINEGNSEAKIKEFINNLNTLFKTNVFDTQRGVSNSTLRLPGTYNFKDDKTPVLNKTEKLDLLYLKDSISNNTKFIENIKIQTKNIKDFATPEIKTKQNTKGSLFFSKFLNDVDSWEDLKEDFGKAHDRNSIFIKNLAIFLKLAPEFAEKTKNFISFLDDRKKPRMPQLNGYIEKSSFDTINLIEIDQWIKKYDLEYFKIFIPITNDKFKYLCTNPDCIYSTKGLYTEKLLKACPRCKAPMDLVNLKELEEDFKLHFENIVLYQLENYPSTTYLVHNRANDFHYKRNGSSPLKEDLFLKFKNNGANMLFLKGYFKDSTSKSVENQLITYIKENIEIKQLHDLGFEPTDNKLFQHNNREYFNQYVGNDYLNLQISKTKYELIKDCPNIYTILNNLTGFNELGIKYLINLLSFMLQYPHIRTQKMIVFAGEQAAGKGIFSNEILKRLFGGYHESINRKAFDSEFSEFFLNKISISVSEGKHDEELVNLLKDYVTEPEIFIRKKGGSEQSEKVFFTMFVSSNENHPLSVNGRRLVYFRSKVLGGSTKKAGEIGEKIVKAIPNEIMKFAEILKCNKVNFKTINDGFETQAKRDLENSLICIEEQFFNEMSEFETLDSFATYYKKYADYIGVTDLENIGNYISKDSNEIKANFFLDCYNSFKYAKGDKTQETLRQFAVWFYDKFNIDRENKEHCIRRKENSSGKNFYWINLDCIKLCKEKIGTTNVEDDNK